MGITVKSNDIEVPEVTSLSGNNVEVTSLFGNNVSSSEVKFIVVGITIVDIVITLLKIRLI